MRSVLLHRSFSTAVPARLMTNLLLTAGLLFLVWTSRYNYLLFHTLVEFLAIGIAMLVGVVAWYSYPLSRNSFLMFLGIVFPAVAAVDLAHAIAYEGMGVMPGAGADLATRLWVAGRFFEASALVVAPVYLRRQLNVSLVAAVMAAVAAFLLWLVFAGHFPTAYIEGTGLTPFKIFSEYAITGLLALAMAHLWRERGALDPRLFRLIMLMMACTMVSELSFTFYFGVYDVSNLVGHVFKLIAFVVIFRAIVWRGLQEPFSFLSRDVSAYNAIPQPVVVVDRTRRVRQVNEAARRIAGGDATGTDCHVSYHPQVLRPKECPVCRHITAGEPAQDVELHFPETGSWSSVTLTPLEWRGQRRVMVQVMHDITHRKQNELELQAMNRALVTVGASHHALIHSRDEDSLLTAICETVVIKGGYPLAWVGFVENDAGQSIRPVKFAGKEGAYLEEVKFSWGTSALGQAPAGAAVRSGHPAVANDFASDPALAPWKEAALRHGFAGSIAFPLRAHGRAILGVLVLYSERPNAFTEAEIRLLAELADDLGYGLDVLRYAADREAAERSAAEATARLTRSLRETVEALAFTIEKRDPYTAGHQRRVADLATHIGRRMGFSEERLEALAMGGLIHDIGKIYIPAEILNRPGHLSEHEFDIIRTHPEVGDEIVAGVEFPWPVAPMVMQHHERMDGSGYPRHLKGEEIALEARIIAVADVMEAMASHRPYRASLGMEVALEELRKNAGTAFDPNVVAACEQLFRKDGYRFPGEVQPAVAGLKGRLS